MRPATLILLLLLLPKALLAQETLKTRNYGVDQGLPQSSVWDIVQDHYGFLWVSTADGLCRFDGYTFNTYRNNPDDKGSIGGNTTHQIAVDTKGDLWLTHDRGFDKYQSTAGTFTPLYRYDTLRTNVFNKTIGEDRKGFVWVWISGVGLIQYSVKTDSRAGTFNIPGMEAWRNNQFSRDAILDSDGKIWISQRSTSLISFNTSTSKFSFTEMGKELGAICSINDSVLLIGTPKGLIRYNTKADKSQTIPFSSLGSGSEDNCQVTKIILASNNEYWVGTNKGIFVYTDSLRHFLKHYTSCSDGKGNFLFVQTLFKDNSGNIWIGTNGDGLKRHSPKAAPWKHYRSSSDRGDIVKSIYADGHELVFAGYFDNGLDIFSKSKGFIRKIRKGKAPDQFPSDMVYSITALDETRLFLSFSGEPNAYGIYDQQSQTFQDVTPAISKQTGIPGFAGNNFPSAIHLGNDTILFNGRNTLLQLVSNQSGVHFDLIHHFPNEIINSICRDKELRLWVGTMNGYYTRRNGSYDWIKGNPQLSKQVKSIAEDSQGKMWLGTTSGLYVLSQDGAIEKIWRMGDPLINDFIYGILKDNQGNMWFSHNKGLTRYDPVRNTFRNFSAEDGLQSNEFNTGAYYKSISGELYFGGINGVNSFFPEDIHDNPHIPVVQITRIDVHDKPYHSPLVNWAQKHVELDYTQNTLSFEFAGLEYTEPSQNQYAWRLSGVDDDWVNSGNKRFTRYANLPPAEYTFEVKASNNDGVWNEVPVSLSILIVPPYWQTWWFRSIELILGTALIALTAYQISRQRYKRKLRALEMKQTIQHDRERISRELHDNIGAQLSLISSNLDWVMNSGAVKNDDERKVRYDNIHELSKEINSNLRETIWALNKEAITFADFSDRLKSIVQKLHVVRPEVDLQWRDGGTGTLLLTPEEALHLLRICQEAVHNAMRHSKMKTLIVSWHGDSAHYQIEIKDDGQGFLQGQESKEHDGLKNMKKRGSLMGAQVTINSIPGNGTSVTVSK